MTSSPTKLEMPALAPGLELREPGIWFSRSRAPVSYPARGNADCLQLEDGSFWFRHRNRCIVSVARRFGEAAFLDIGGGNGFVARGLMDAGIDCALIEPGIDGALAARARGVDPVICATIEDVALRPASVAAAGMFDVLEHIEDEAAALGRVRELLVTGGRLFLTVPSYGFLFSSDDHAAGHYRRYTLAGLSRALRGAGFRVAFASYMFMPLPPVVFVRRTLPSRLGFHTGLDPERAASEHAPDGAAARLMRHALDFEFRRIEAGKTLPFGSSCLAVAVKD